MLMTYSGIPWRYQAAGHSSHQIVAFLYERRWQRKAVSGRDRFCCRFKCEVILVKWADM